MGTTPNWAQRALPDREDYNLLVEFIRRGVQPPALEYLTRDDQLLVELWNPISAATITISIRTMDPDGTITPQVYALVGPTVGATASTLLIQGVEGFLLSCNISSTATQRGQCFVKVRMQRGMGTSDVTRGGVICQGYAWTNEDLCYPNSRPFSPLEGRGNMRVIQGNTPAAGVEISDTVPLGVHWIVRAVEFQLVASATVATRLPALLVDDGANVIWRGLPGTSVTAGQTFLCSYANGNTVFSNASNTFIAPFPAEFRIRPGFRLRTLTTAIQAGDQFSAIVYYVEEFIANG